MSTHEHTPDELMHALQVIRSECRAHPESCTECPLSFNDGGPTPAEWDISPTQRWQAFSDETRRADP